MSDMLNANTYWAIGAAAVVAFIAGALWNSPFLFGPTREALAGLGPDQTFRPSMAIAEFLRCLVLAITIAVVLTIVRPRNLSDALLLSVLLWFGLQASLLIGGVIWERMPLRLFAVHAGDALIKILLVTACITVLRS